MGTLQKLSDYDKSVPHIGWNYAAMITLNPYGVTGRKQVLLCAQLCSIEQISQAYVSRHATRRGTRGIWATLYGLLGLTR